MLVNMLIYTYARSSKGDDYAVAQRGRKKAVGGCCVPGERGRGSVRGAGRESRVVARARGSADDRGLGWCR